MSDAAVLPIRLEVDADRDGRLEPGEPGRWDWRWAPGGPGAVVLPDLGQRPGEIVAAPVRLVVEQDAYSAVAVNRYAAPFVTIHRGAADGSREPIVGLIGENIVPQSGVLEGPQDLWVQVHQLPDAGFDGLVELIARLVTLGPDGTPQAATFTDRAVLRASPWIMTPNTCVPERVYAVEVPDTEPGPNEKFLEDLGKACAAAGVELTRVDSAKIVGGAVPGEVDRWMQDEIEFGYVAAPGEMVPVVVDGPRNRGLDSVAASGQLGTGLGSVLIDADFDVRTSLDSFGNLEIAPPVTARGREYPLGRIVFGTRRPDDDAGNKAALRLRQFLYEQRLQTPFEIYTDWLAVGHVDEVISFVPWSDPPGFRVLVASPDAARGILDAIAADGHGDALLWREQRLSTGGSAEETVTELLEKQDLWAFNEQLEADALARVRSVLVEELALSDDALVSIPVVFETDELGKAGAYFPDMVNHLVLGDVSVVPRPYGPLDDDGVDLLEQAFRDAVPDRAVHFVDDWLSYHKMLGEVHCGTNVLRKPIEGVDWWDHTYEGVFNTAFPGG